MDWDESDLNEDSFFRRNRIAVCVVGVVVVGGVVFGIKSLSGGSGAPPKTERITMISLPPPPAPPPPPPPPPPPQQPPPQEQKMEEQTPVNEPEQKPDPKPEPPSAPVATGITGNGPGDGFGLSGSGNGNWFGKGGNGSGRQGSRWGWYAGQVQSKIQEALRTNRKTRSARMQIEVRIWPDNTGRVTRASLAKSTGDAAMDEAIKSEVLTGLQLQEPPPQGMPTPIVLRLTARRPN